MANYIFRKMVNSGVVPVYFFKLNEDGSRSRIPVYMRGVNGVIRLDQHTEESTQSSDVNNSEGKE